MWPERSSAKRTVRIVYNNFSGCGFSRHAWKLALSMYARSPVYRYTASEIRSQRSHCAQQFKAAF